MKEQSHPLLQAFTVHLKKSFSFIERGHDTAVLLAISGGMDSVVLSELLNQSGIKMIWAHCNFGLRGAESDRDEAFVRELAANKNIPLHVRSFDTRAMAATWKMSIEETARKLRYDWFAELLADPALFSDSDRGKAIRNIYLATAHHGNDHIETLLLNFFRGCGLAGLHGIPARNGVIIRPLLPFKRSELAAFAKDQQLNWVEDSTNQSVDYTRNFFRQEMLPAIRAYFPTVEDNLLDNIHRFTQAELLYKQALEKYRKQLMIPSGKEYLLSVRLLLKSGIARTLLWELLKDYGFGQGQIPEVEKLLQAGTGAFQDSSTHRIFRNRAHLVLTPLEPDLSEVVLIRQGDTAVRFADGGLRLEYLSDASAATSLAYKQQDPDLVHLDAAQVHFPLLLRKWQPGDYFYPLGMRKKKKLSRFFIDQKLSMTQKEHAWVLVSDNRILWAVGWRLDDRFRIHAGTKKILKLQLQHTNV